MRASGETFLSAVGELALVLQDFGIDPSEVGREIMVDDGSGSCLKMSCDAIAAKIANGTARRITDGTNTKIVIDDY